MKRITQTLLSFALVLGLVGLYIPQSSAVIQNLTVLDTAGKPVGGQSVTIVFPAGVTDADGNTQAEEETDDDGGLYFDFPGDGDYLIKYPGGQMIYVVKGGVPTYIKVGGALIGAGVIWAAADDSGNGGDRDSSNGGSINGGSNGGNGGTNGGNGGTNGGNGGTNGGNGGTNGGNGGTNGGNGGTNGGNGGTNGGNGGQADPDGDYEVIGFFIIENDSNHPEGPLRDALYIILKDRDSNAIEITITGPGVSATLTGTCNDDGNFTITGSGTFSGFSTTFSMQGNVNGAAGTMEAEVSAGNDGMLPGGDPIVADIDTERAL